MPHKTLHFSDGVLEEYSETEDEEDETDKPPEIDPVTVFYLSDFFNVCMIMHE